MKTNNLAYISISIGILVVLLDWIIFYSYYLTILGFIFFCFGVVKSSGQIKKILTSQSILVSEPQYNQSKISQQSFELESQYDQPIIQQNIQEIEN